MATTTTQPRTNNSATSCGTRAARPIPSALSRISALTKHPRLNAVLALNDRDALEQFARDEQAKRDAVAEATWMFYRLSPNGDGVVNPKGITYYLPKYRGDKGQMVFSGVRDQEFCDVVNKALAAAFADSQCFCFRMETKHYLILWRLQEAQQGQMSASTVRGW